MTPEQIQEALTHRCEFCGAEPNCNCISTIDGRPLTEVRNGFPVHYYRKEAS